MGVTKRDRSPGSDLQGLLNKIFKLSEILSIRKV